MITENNREQILALTIEQGCAPEVARKNLQLFVDFHDAVFSQAIKQYKDSILAEVGEPAQTLFQHEDTGRFTTVASSLASNFERMNKRWINCGNLYTADAILSAVKPLRERIAKLESEITRLTNRLNKDSQEFTILCAVTTERELRQQNAELQKQRDELADELKTLRGCLS